MLVTIRVERGLKIVWHENRARKHDVGMAVSDELRNSASTPHVAERLILDCMYTAPLAFSTISKQGQSRMPS